jgi:hypothetical protein
MASSRPWPFDDDDDRPSGSVQPLTQADLQAILAHLTSDPDQLLAGTGADRPVVAVRVRASVGRPGGSAQARWRRLRAAEWAAWTQTLPWRVAATLGIGAGGGVLGSLIAPRLVLVLGGLAAVAVGWGCGFGPARRPSPGGGGRRGSSELLGCLVRWSSVDGWSSTTWPSQVAGPISTTWPSAPAGSSWSTPSSIGADCNSTGLGGYGMAVTPSPLPCRRCRSRPTRPPESCPTRASWWCRSWPSMAPRFPGARWS